MLEKIRDWIDDCESLSELIFAVLAIIGILLFVLILYLGPFIIIGYIVLRIFNKI